MIIYRIKNIVINTGRTLSKDMVINQRVIPKCSISPTLFNTYIDIIIQKQINEVTLGYIITSMHYYSLITSVFFRIQKIIFTFK